MNRATPEMRGIAAKLISHESGKSKVSRKKKYTGFGVPDKLRPHLATLMGNGGYRALVMRSLALAGNEVPWLRCVRVSIDGVLEEPEGMDHQIGNEDASEGGVVLAARLLGLLVAFIGEQLTLRLVCEVWPEISSQDLDFSGGDKHEKTK